MKFIFIISTGRSGSTILQYLLNSHKHILIRGENANFFFYLMLAFQSIHARSGPVLAKRENLPWYGIENFNSEDFQKKARVIGSQYLLGDKEEDEYKILGFKEIRFFDIFNSQETFSHNPILRADFRNKHECLESYIRFLGDIFCPAKFILLTRDPDNIVKSGWWADENQYNHSILKRDIASFYSSVRKIFNANKNISGLEIDYKLLENKDHNKLERFLFEPLEVDYSRAIAETILRERLVHCKYMPTQQGGTKVYSSLNSKYDDAIIRIDAQIRRLQSLTAKDLMASSHFSELYRKKALRLHELGMTDQAFRAIQEALRYSPYCQQLANLYMFISKTKERIAVPSSAIGLIITHEGNFSKAVGLAEFLICSTVPIEVMIVISDNAVIPSISPCKVIRVKSGDDYESLPGKVSKAFIEIATRYSLGTNIFKIDDDIAINDVERFSDSCRQLIDSNADYAGFPVNDPNHNRIWHWNKCLNKSVDRSVFSKRWLGAWASGPFYYLSAAALQRFAFARFRFPDDILGELYEDKFVSDVLRHEGIGLVPLRADQFSIEL